MQSIPSRLASLGRTAARRLFADRAAEAWLRAVEPTWSLAEIRARVVDVIAETPDVKTFVLAPNWRWTGHRAGQHTMLEVEIDGVRVRRCFSIASPPGARHLSLTVKRAGRVTGWMHDRLRPGDVVGLSPAAGDFVLPAHPPAQLLLISGGSGITPVMAILRDLIARDAIRDVVFVHHATHDVIFGRELAALRHPGLRVIVHTAPFDEATLAREVPDVADRTTYLCGPPGFMARVEAMCGPVHRERFAIAAPPAADAQLVTIRLASGTTVTASTAAPLLAELERAGARPPSGCRIGICHTCKQRKRAGTVANLVTGARSSEPDEDIQLCISVACSDLELDL